MNLLNNIKIGLGFHSKVHGIFSTSIPYEIRNPSGDWSKYFGQYEGQKHDDLDSNCCWAYSGNEVLEDQLELLWKTGQFSKETMQWFQDNGYIDADGDFYLSRRFIPIISGVGRNGNDPAEFWRLTAGNVFSTGYGAIPDKVLPYTNNLEYFDKTKITPEMYALGEEFLNKVNIRYQEVGSRFMSKSLGILQGALYQSELQIGVPVGDYYIWNSGRVKWEGGKGAQHAIALWKIDEAADYDYPYFIYDQYNPMLKQLSRDYFLPIVTQAVVTAKVQVVPNPVSQSTVGADIWRAIMAWFGFNLAPSYS